MTSAAQIAGRDQFPSRHTRILRVFNRLRELSSPFDLIHYRFAGSSLSGCVRAQHLLEPSPRSIMSGGEVRIIFLSARPQPLLSPLSRARLNTPALVRGDNQRHNGSELERENTLPHHVAPHEFEFALKWMTSPRPPQVVTTRHHLAFEHVSPSDPRPAKARANSAIDGMDSKNG